MKKIWSTILIAFLVCRIFAASAVLSWNQNCSPIVVGYKIYAGPLTSAVITSTVYTNDCDGLLYTNLLYPNVKLSLVGTFPATATGCTVSGLSNNVTYLFSATTYDSSNNESILSHEILYTPQDPSTAKLTMYIEYRTNFYNPPQVILYTNRLHLVTKTTNYFSLVPSNVVICASNSNLSGYTFYIQSSTNLFKWTTVSTNRIPFAYKEPFVYSQRFYRLLAP